MAALLSAETLFEVAHGSLHNRYLIPEERAAEVGSALKTAVDQHLNDARISAGVDEVLVLRQFHQSLHPPLEPRPRSTEAPVSKPSEIAETTAARIKRHALLGMKITSEATVEGLATALGWGAVGLIGTVGIESAAATAGAVQSRTIIEALGPGVAIYGPAVVAGGIGLIRGTRQGIRNGLRQSKETITSFVDKPQRMARFGV
jgi:hypothetical protein